MTIQHADRIGAIWKLLADVPDPEIPAVSIVDLGIVRSVDPGPLTVALTPTYTGCPATQVIGTAVRRALDDAGHADVRIVTHLDPPWTTDWITVSGREKLRAYGIAPPRATGGSVCCPRCGSAETQEVSRFGSTPCKSLWRCLSCAEPLDSFKCH